MSSKIFKLIWLIGIYSILGIILYLVIEYKVVWENKDLNTYLYFYNCNNNLCTSTTIPKEYYNRIICENNICPYITNIINDNVILSNSNKSWMYNYITEDIKDDNYKTYELIKNNYFIVTNQENKQGITDLLGNIVVNTTYEKIHNYHNNILLYKENNVYKIKKDDVIYDLDPQYTDIVLINETLFAAKKDNIYRIYKYNNLTEPYNEYTYEYIYAHNDVLLTINNKKIDILTTKLNSTLIMKIDTFFEYQIEKERGSLNIKTTDDFLYFNVFKNEKEYIQYIYNLKEKKLV